MEQKAIAVYAAAATLGYAILGLLSALAGDQVRTALRPDQSAELTGTGEVVGAAFTALDHLALATAAVALGWYVGRQIDIQRRYREYLIAVAAGSLVAGLGIQAVVAASTDTLGSGIGVLAVINQAIRVPTSITLPSFAGATLVQFRTAQSPQLSKYSSGDS